MKTIVSYLILLSAVAVVDLYLFSLAGDFISAKSDTQVAIGVMLVFVLLYINIWIFEFIIKKINYKLKTKSKTKSN